MNFAYRFIRKANQLNVYRRSGPVTREERALLRDVMARFEMYSMNIKPEILNSTIEPLAHEYNSTSVTGLVNTPPVPFASNLTRSSEMIYQILRDMIQQHQQTCVIVALLVLLIVTILTIVLRRCCCDKRKKHHAIQSRYDGTLLSFDHDGKSPRLSIALVETTAHRTVCPATKPLINKVHTSTANETVRQEEDAVSPQLTPLLAWIAVTSIYRLSLRMDTLIFRRTHKNVHRQDATDALLPTAAAKQHEQSTWLNFFFFFFSFS